MKPYRLAPSVYACASDDGAVFLNLANDAYAGIDALQAGALSLVVEDWPRAPARETGAYDEALSFAEFLRERNLLVSSDRALASDDELGDRGRVLQLPLVESELIPWEHMSSDVIRMGHVFRFIQSLLTALYLLRRRRFSDVVRRVQQRRVAYVSCPVCAPKVRELLSAFFHIRTFIYAPKSRCLLDSLTLLEFLAHYGQYPEWVIGVRVLPFGSHTWLQHDAFVLNGTPDYVRAYTPIVVV